MSTQHHRRRVGGMVAAAAAATALALSACSPPTTPAEDVAQDLAIGIPAISVPNLDPFGTTALGQGQFQVTAQIFDYMVNYVDGEYVPSIATEWESSDDAKEWTITIREGVTFSDGSELSAEDVKASVDQVITLAGPLAGIFKPLVFTVDSPTQVTITSELGQGALLGKLSMLPVGPSELIASPDFGLNPIGSGPFIVDAFDPSGGVDLVANEDYWNGRPLLDTVSFKMIPEAAARNTALETGEIQLTWGVPDDAVAALSSNTGLVVDSTPTLANILIWPNSGRPGLSDPDVRGALVKAVDWETLITTLFPNTGATMEGPLPLDVFGSSVQTPYEYDPEAAKDALDKAGFDYAQTFEMLGGGSIYEDLLRAIISDWAKIGVTVELQTLEPAVSSQRLLALDWDFAVVQPVNTSTGDADYNLGRLYTCAANRTGYCNPELDELLTAAGSSVDMAEREELYTEAGKIIWDETVGIFPMTVVHVWAWRAGLEGVIVDPIYKPDLTKIQFTS
jgi:peptide/nickel transport system substrate-binding protein